MTRRKRSKLLAIWQDCMQSLCRRVRHDTLIAVLRRQLTCGNSTTWDSNRGMAMCQALYVLPRNLMSSDGNLGCGWLRLMPSSKAYRHTHRSSTD